jgi:hypothetical protein
VTRPRYNRFVNSRITHAASWQLPVALCALLILIFAISRASWLPALLQASPFIVLALFWILTPLTLLAVGVGIVVLVKRVRH